MNHVRTAAMPSQAPSSASFPRACISGPSLADTRSITSVTTPSHTPAHTSAAPAFTEPSALPCAIRLSSPRRKSRAVLRLSSSSKTARDFRLGLESLMAQRSEEHTSELQSLAYLVCRLLLEKKKN